MVKIGQQREEAATRTFTQMAVVTSFQILLTKLPCLTHLSVFVGIAPHLPRGSIHRLSLARFDQLCFVRLKREASRDRLGNEYFLDTIRIKQYGSVALLSKCRLPGSQLFDDFFIWKERHLFLTSHKFQHLPLLPTVVNFNEASSPRH
jgi:hypothetical protein